MNPKDDENALGSVLLELGILTQEQLDVALERQENSTLEQMLGMILVHEGVCSKEEIEVALSAQRNMRGGKTARAVAVLDIAIYRKKSNGARDRAIQKAVTFARAQTGSDHVAVTVEMLAKWADEG